MNKGPRILICYLVRNSGHHAAARAIEAEVLRQHPGAETRCLDLLENHSPDLELDRPEGLHVHHPQDAGTVGSPL